VADIGRRTRTPANGWSRALVAIWSLRLGLHIAVRARGERYRDYQSHTSVFLPLPPEKGMIT
jgi:steroid 5-alpha reductase family enzyme